MTTETKHTPEPWRIARDAADRNVIRGGAEEKPTTVIVADSWVKEANARRIVACVNACAGMNIDGELLPLNPEHVPELWVTRGAFDATRKQRDELAAALRAIMAIGDPYLGEHKTIIKNARAALAKVPS